MEGWILDLKQAFRSLSRRPLATLTIVAIVMLAVGATTSVFTVVEGVLLQPLPYADSERLARLWQTRDDWATSPNLSYRKFADRFLPHAPAVREWSRADTGFASIGAYVDANFVLQGADRAEVLRGQEATAGFFTALAAEPLTGRYLQSGDDAEGAPRVVVLSQDFWKSRFEGRDVLGSDLILNGQPHTMIGVMSEQFQPPTWDVGAGRPVLWTALTEEARVGNKSVLVIGRLAEGVSLVAADQRLKAVQAGLATTLPRQKKYGTRVVGLLDSIVGEVRSTLWFLFAAVALVLIIATVNIANFLTVLGLERRHELAVRSALGAEKGRLMRGLFVESALLAALGGGGGILLALAGLPLLLRIVPASLPRHEQIGVSPGVLLCGIAMTGLTALLAGGLPAMLAARAQPQEALRSSSRGLSSGHASGRIRGLLVVAEVALAFILLIGAGLLATSFARLWSQERGFSTSGLATLTVAPDSASYPTRDDRDAFMQVLRSRFDGIPGVSATVANNVPLSGEYSGTFFFVEGQSQDSESRTKALLSVGLENYLEVMGIPILAGRGFDNGDQRDTRPVAIINETMARGHWPGAPPLGRRLRLDDGPWVEIVGVAADVRHVGLEAAVEPKVYLPAAQSRRDTYEWILRIEGGLPPAIEQARHILASLSPRTAVRRVRVIDETISDAVAVPRFRTYLVVGLAVMAAVLALLGVYGILAFTVAQRTQEMGIRIALGAGRRRVIQLIVGTGLKLTLAGVGIGLVIAWLAAELIEQFLFEITPGDPQTYLQMVIGVLVVSCLAAYLPARRAAAVDPMSVLRSD